MDTLRLGMADSTPQDLLATALARHQAGDLDTAEGLYKQVLQQAPNQADALHLLGLISLQRGQAAAAVELIGRALSANPGSSVFLLNQALAYEALGDPAQAVRCLEQASTREPHRADIQLRIGGLHEALGNFEAAIAAFRSASELDERSIEAAARLGVALQQTRHLEEAAAQFRRALRLQPDFAAVHGNLGTVYQEFGQLDLALQHHRRATELAPGEPRLWFNLANAQSTSGSLEEAAASYVRAIELAPDYAEALRNLGGVWRDMGDFERSLASFRAATEALPDYAEAHFGLASELLRQGNLDEGWPEFEWRWRCDELISQARHQELPAWRGQRLDGARLLVHTEQGFGDAIQFVRFVPLLQTLGARVTLECFPVLKRLFAQSGLADQLVAQGEPIASADCQVPLMSLPGLLKVNLATIPNRVPYLIADPELVKAWETRLPAGEWRVGVAWRARQGKPNDHRSINKEDVALLADVPEATVISLQNDESPPGGITDVGTSFTDFADTAAVIDQLDLVISVDTAAAHLAGALGKPVWLLLPVVPEWRWLLDREDSPWYPTMRIFRQSRGESWAAVVTRVALALSERK